MGLLDGLGAIFGGPQNFGGNMRKMAGDQRAYCASDPGGVMRADDYVLRVLFNKDVTSKARRERMATRRAERRAARRAIGRHGCSK